MAAKKRKEAAALSDDASLATLGSQLANSPVKRSKAASSADRDDDVLASLQEAKVLDGPRPRDKTRVPLRDCVIGFAGDEEQDPCQSGQCTSRQSDEITSLTKRSREKVPVHKDERANYVWVAKAKGQGPERYTTNPEMMAQCLTYRLDADNRCDVCGICCTEVLFEFRCYRRAAFAQGLQQSIIEGGERRLDAFVSYISKRCGEGLLGKQSEASKFREMVYTLISSADVESQFEAVWRQATKEQRRLLEEELRFFSRLEAGDNKVNNAVELRKAGLRFGTLHPFAEDVFRALGRAVGPVISARELAAVTVLQATTDGAEPQSGYLAQVAGALRSRQPLPAAPKAWSERDVSQTLSCLVRAWPLHLQLESTLRDEVSHFKPTQSDVEVLVIDGFGDEWHCKLCNFNNLKERKACYNCNEPHSGSTRKALQTLRLVHLSGCQELHAIATEKLSKQDQHGLRAHQRDALTRCRSEFGTMSSGSHGPTKTQDAAVSVPEMVNAEFVLKVLMDITWPDCKSRKNVRPEGVESITAFMVGLVKPWFLALMCSTRTRLLPNVSRMIARFGTQDIAKLDPGFRYTSVQLNRDYNAKLHVDKNNHGPSYIIGLGDYTGGELWIHDEEHGTHKLKVTENLRGHPNLRVGSFIKGRAVDIKNTWMKFDGNTPHCAMPFTGTRISLVYFTRRGWLAMPPEPKAQLENLEFAVPGEEFLTAATQTPDEKFSGQRACDRAAADAEDDRESEEDEIDEDEEMHKEDPADWAQSFRSHLSLDWVTRPLSVAMSTCNVVGPAPVLALKELWPAGKPTVLVVSEDGDISAIKMSKGTLRLTPPTVAYKDLKFSAKGKGYCEVSHKPDQAAPQQDEDLFVASFKCLPFLNKDVASKRNCFDDPNAAAFKALRAHIEARRPKAALLEVSDFAALPPAQVSEVLKFVLEGVDTQKNNASWGLKLLSGYHVEIAEINLKEFGATLGESRLHIYLLREDCGGPQELEAVTSLVRLLHGLMPPNSVQELLLEDTDPLIKSTLEKSKLLPAAAAQAKTKTLVVENKIFAAEEKELGMKPGSTPYTDLIRDQKGLDFVSKEWYPQALPSQKQALNICYQRALLMGADVDSLVIDLGRSLKERAWRDDGLLPLVSGSHTGLHYTFQRHRPLTGVEELLCRRYSTSKLQLRGIQDRELCRLAANAMALPAVGASLCALLAVANLHRAVSSDARLPRQKLHALLARAPVLAEGGLCVESLEEATKKAAEQLANADAQLEARAAALLNLMRHGNFAQGGAGAEGEEVATPSAEEVAVLEALKKAAVGREEQLEVIESQPPAAAIDAFSVIPQDDPLDWEVRSRRLRLQQVHNVSFGSTIRWVQEAADDPDALHATEIISVGLENLLKEVREPKKPLTMEHLSNMDKQMRSLREVVGAAGHKDQVEILWDTFAELHFQRKFENNDPSIRLHNGRVPMQGYVPEVLEQLQTAKVKRAFLDHLAKTLADGRLADDFAAHGGFQAVVSFFESELAGLEADGKLDKDWKGFPNVLLRVCKGAPPSTPCLLRVIYACSKRLMNKKAWMIETGAQEAMSEAVAAAAGKFPADKSLLDLLKDFSRSEGLVGERFDAMRQFIDRVCSAGELLTQGEETQNAQQLHAVKVDLESAEQQSREVAKNVAGVKWERVREVEDLMYSDIHSKLLARIAIVTERERQRIADAMRREEDKRREQQQQAREQVCEAANQKARQIKALLIDERLADDSRASFDEFLKKMAELKDRVTSCEESRVPVPPEALDAVEAARKASEYVCQASFRRYKVRSWLLTERFGHCFQIFDQRDLWHDVCQAFEQKTGSSILASWNLPSRLRKRLSKAVAAGPISDQDFHARSPPGGWKYEFSKKTGLHFIQNPATRESRWQWPDIPDDAGDITALPEPPPPQIQGEMRADEAPYIVYDRSGTLHSLLTCGKGMEELRTEKHQNLRRRWDQAAEKFQTETASWISSDGGQAVDYSPALVAAWRGELRAVVVDDTMIQDITIVIAFWHQVVLPHLPVTFTSTAVKTALERMWAAARAPEPLEKVELQEPPAPGLDFPCYPPPVPSTLQLSKESSEENLPKFNAEELLGEGIEVRSEGYYCGHCDVTFLDLAKHLHPWYNDAKNHRRNQEYSSEAFKNLKAAGFNLLNVEGVRVVKKMYNCTFCNKNDLWYNLWGEGGHLQSNNHKKIRNQHAPKASLPVDEDEWVYSLINASKERYQSMLEESRRALVARTTPGTPSPAAASPLPSQQPRPALGQDAESVSKAPRLAGTLPPLPVPGTDFPCYPARKGTSADAILNLDDDSLRGEGIERRAGGWYCGYCELDIPSPSDHLRPDSKVKKGHDKNAGGSREEVARIGNEGWKFPYEGVALCKLKFSCKLCNASGEWWNAFMHIGNKKHIGRRESWSQDLPMKPSPEEQSEQQAAWRMLIADGGTVAASSSSTAPVSQPQSPIAPLKRPRLTTAPPVTPILTIPAAPVSGQPQGAKKIPEGLQWEPAPDDDQIAQATERAKNVGYPEPPHPALCWGHNAKKNGLWLYCRECQTWVGWALLNLNTDRKEQDPDGLCDHYDLAARARFHDALMAVR